MREILFRAKHKEYNQWVEGDLIHEPFGECIQFVKDECRSKIKVDPKTVCQYTRLNDKNGRKIFEGDIVRYTDEVIGKEKVDEIKYNETHAAFCRLHKSEMGLQYLLIDEAIANKIEVIGNTFDNPELIEE